LLASPADFAVFRQEMDAKSDSPRWTELKKDLPKGEPPRQRTVDAWVDGRDLQMLTLVDSSQDHGAARTTFYWLDGQLVSAVAVRESAQATDTYNFAHGDLVTWKQSREGQETLADTASPGFAAAAKRVIAESKEAADSIRKAAELE
jgi:hypothetical protein